MTLDCRHQNLTGSLLDYYTIEELQGYSKIISSYNELTEIPNIIGLHTLYCDYNRLTSLPNIIGLKELSCTDNQITEIPNIKGLQQLFCAVNQLTTLPNIIGLQRLYCELNQLTSIPNIEGLLQLHCTSNHLTEIPNIIGLQKLYCKNNQFMFNFGNTIKRWEIYHKLKSEHQNKLVLIDFVYINLIDDIRYILKKQLTVLFYNKMKLLELFNKIVVENSALFGIK